MKLINGQIRLIEKFDTENRDRAYVCEQLENPGLECFVKILDIKRHQGLIEDYIENIEFYKSINHKGILSTIDFGPVQTVDLKDSTGGLYYILTEYTPWERLDEVKDNLGIGSRVTIILKLIQVLEYLHFRGISYDVLSPDKIFVTSEGELKLLNLTSIVHSKLQIDNLKKISEYVAPEGKENYNGKNIQTDHWSLGVIMDKLFSGVMSELSVDKQNLISSTIEDLMARSTNSNKKSLKDRFEDIRSEFSMDYKRCLRNERETLQLGVLPIRKQESYRHYLSSKSFDEIYERGYSGLIIDGNGGIGKKKYIREILRRRKLEGHRTYVLEAGQGDYSSIDYFKAFLVQLCEVLGITYRVDPESNSMKLRFNESFEFFRLDQLDSKLKLFNCITENLIKLSKRETVYLGLLNIHEADLEIFNLIDFIVTKSRGKRIFFLFSSQNSKLIDTRKSNIMNHWLKNFLFEEVHLENLSKEEAEEYIHGILGSVNIPRGFSHALYNETLGNPRYIRVLVKHFFDNGIIRIDKNGLWTTTTDEYSSFYDSATLKTAIVRQIKSLSETELNALNLLSCFSYPVDWETFNDILRVDSLEFRETVLELTNKGITRIDMQKEKSISFVEGDFKRQIYSDLSENKRIDSHKRIADVLLSKRYGNHVINFDSLIHHLSESRQLDRMIKIVLQRLEKEKNRYNENSVNILKACYKNLKGKDHPSTLIILKYLTEALLAQRRYTEGIDSARVYIDEAERMNDSEHKIHAELTMFEFMIRAGEYNDALEKISEYEAMVTQQGNGRHRINLYKLKAIIYQVLDRIEKSQAAIDKALELANEYGIHEHDGDLYNLQGIGNYLVGDHEKALDSYHKSIKTYVLSERAFDRIKPLNNIGNLYNEIIGDPQEALEYYFKCLKVSDENGLSSFQTITLSNICDVYLTLGSYDAARTYIDKTIDLSRINGDRINEFHGTVYRGILELSLQNMEAATEIFLKVREFNKEEPIVEKEVIIHYLDFLGRFYMELGDYDLGKLFSRNTMDKSKDFNPKLFFRSRARILTIDAIVNGNICKSQIETLFNEFAGKTNDFEKASFLIEMMHISLHIPDKAGYEFLRSIYLGINSIEVFELYGNDFEIMNVLAVNNGQYVENATELLEGGNKRFTQSICRYYAYFGEMLFEDGDYKSAARYLIRSMDLVQRKINQIGIDGYREKILVNYNIPKIESILDEIFREKFHIAAKILDSKERESSLVGRYLSMLNFNQYNELFLNWDDHNVPTTLEGLLSCLTQDYRCNLEIILMYLHREAGASASLINIFSFTELKNDLNLVSIGEPIVEMDQFMDNTLRSGEKVIFNRDLGILSMDVSEDYFDRKLSGFIGVPIIEPLRKDIEVDRRSGSRRSKILGYVYLQADSAINRFDMERLQLSISLAKMIYLNLENSKLNRRANFDRLTNVLSRESIDNELVEVIETYSGTDDEFSVLMMDIDKFKDINDTYGHQKGDQILETIGKILNENTRSSDSVGRYGGEEFLILLENITIEDTKSVAEEIRRSIEIDRRFAIDRKVTVSIGASHYPNQGTSKDELVYKADQSLYFAKEVLGRNHVAVWDIDMEEIENINGKGHKVSMELFGRSENGIVSLMDIAVLSRSQEPIDKKVFRFLGAVNESIDAELSSVLLICDGEVTEQYTREGVKGNWIENKKIATEMIEKILESKESYLTVNWAGAVHNMGTIEFSSLKSIIMTPVLVGDSIRGIVYCEASLRRKDFTSADVMALEVLSGVFSVNFV
ncbi:diguanylate cyclase [Gudongella sp. SC589]|uniref:diguanylate cyclase n=1 Tax=Gudongella sp. SC589 TaxID=3385990 RepID=UPI003904DAC7